MLTRRFLVTPSDAKSILPGIAALALLFTPVTFNVAQAGGMESTTCIGGRYSVSCYTQWGRAVNPYVRSVGSRRTDEEEAEFLKRDRQWEARCHPVIQQDRYGVSRYYYAAPGCEYGVLQD